MRVLWWDNNNPEIEERWLRSLVQQHILPQKNKEKYGINLVIGGNFVEKFKSQQPQHYQSNRSFAEKYNRRFVRVIIKAPAGEPISSYLRWLHKQGIMHKPRSPITAVHPEPMGRDECAVELIVDTYSVIELEE